MSGRYSLNKIRRILKRTAVIIISYEVLNHAQSRVHVVTGQAPENWSGRICLKKIDVGQTEQY